MKIAVFWENEKVRKIGQEVESINISLEEHELNKIEKIKRKLRKKKK